MVYLPNMFREYQGPGALSGRLPRLLVKSAPAQGCPNWVLEGQYPAEFRSTLPQHTCRKNSSMPSKSFISCLRCVWWVLELEFVHPWFISSDWHLSVLCFCHTHGSVNVGIAHLVYFHLHIPVVGKSCTQGSCHNGSVRFRAWIGNFGPGGPVSCRV